MSILHVPFLIVAVLLFALAGFRPHQALVPLGLAFLAAALLAAAI